MAGYAVVAVVGADAIRIGGSSGRTVDDRAPGLDPATIEDAPLEDVRVVRSWSSRQIREHGAGIRRAWAQTTFYLFDPSSWR